MYKKRSFWSNIIKQSSWYYLCSALNNGLAILLLPFLSRRLSTEEYGIIQLSTGIGLFLPMVFSCGIDRAIYRFFNECRTHKAKKELISTVYWFVVIVGMVFLTIFVLSSSLWFKSVVHISPYPYVLLFAYPYLFAELSTIGQSYFQQVFDLKRMTIIEVIGTAINLLLSIYFVVTWDDGALARLVAITISFFFKSSIYSYYLLKRNLLVFRCNYIKVWEYVKFSLPLLPNSISLWLSRTFDRILISYYCGTAIAGVYSTAVQVSFVLYFIQDSVTQAFGPMQIRLFIQNKVEAVRCLKIMSKIFYIIMLVSVVFLSSFCKEIMNFVLDEKFVPPVIVVALLSSVYIYQAQYRLFSDILIYHKKNKYFMYAGIIQAVISLLINIVFIPKYGYVVAGWSSLIAVMLYTLIIAYYSVKIENLSLDYSFYIKYTLILMLALFLLLNPLFNMDMHILLKLLLVSGILVFGIRDVFKLKKNIV